MKLDNNRKKNIMKNRKEKKMDKQKAINFLYKDWLDYKKHIESGFDDGYVLQETFTEYLEREIIMNERIEYEQASEQKE
ncbi:MAG: hypothetical protein CBD16_00050 [Betaproteobacteria bacterium TMED156]|nr:MAG: hypothetical protein CBD16_00050 [Betaproteobacteria bacterium TMED156]|tara:strand:- start:778 stop:1014 length:237 start_codon:yes stop_codon:yes gene_type:complete